MGKLRIILLLFLMEAEVFQNKIWPGCNAFAAAPPVAQYNLELSEPLCEAKR